MTDRRFALVAIAAAACALPVVSTVWSPAPRLVWNASASAPVGLYSTYPGAPIGAGDMVIAHLPPTMAWLAARRHYLPLNVPLVKRVAAIAGAQVCAVGSLITIDGRPFVRRLARDRRGRPLPAWSGCRKVGKGEAFLAMANVPDSFDGRYFGITPAADIVARAVPLWVR